MSCVLAGPSHPYYHESSLIKPWCCPYCGSDGDDNGVDSKRGSCDATLVQASATFAELESDGPAKGET